MARKTLKLFLALFKKLVTRKQRMCHAFRQLHSKHVFIQAGSIVVPSVTTQVVEQLETFFYNRSYCPRL